MISFTTTSSNNQPIKQSNSMNTSQFMDKQIMDLSNSQSKPTDFMDLNIHPHQHDDVTDDGSKKDEILPNYDFQPIRPITSSNFDSGSVGGPRVWSSADLDSGFGARNYRSLDSVEPSKVAVEKDRTVLDAALISEIDRTMKKHADNLMHAIEGVSARLSQLETRSRNLENSVDDLRTSVGNNHGNTDGKLRQIENIIREVQAGVQIVKDKQEILETQLQISKVQISKTEKQPESLQQQAAVASAPLQSHHQLPPATLPQQHSVALPNAPPPPIPQPNQFPQNVMPMPVSHHDSYYPPSQTTDPPPPPPPQQYQLPAPQQLQPPMASPSSPRPQYQPPPQIQYSQPPPMSLQQPNPPQNQPPSELAYLASQNYAPSGGPPAQQFHGNPSQSTQQFHGNPSQMYEQPPPPPPGRTGSGFPSQYGSSPGFGESYGYGGSQYGSGSPVKSQQHSSPNMGPGSGSGYPQLPTARVLPQAIPAATAVGGGSGSGGGSSSGSGSGNRVPIDDVVDKVTNMGFSRDQVRATVRKLTENGQAVDLNVVLDKLMTDGVESQNPRAWFGR